MRHGRTHESTDALPESRNGSEQNRVTKAGPLPVGRVATAGDPASVPRARIEVRESGCCGRHLVEYTRRPALSRGSFVRVFTGWDWIRAEVMTAVRPVTHDFGVRLFAFQQEGPWHWLAVNQQGVLWVLDESAAVPGRREVAT